MLMSMSAASLHASGRRLSLAACALVATSCGKSNVPPESPSPPPQYAPAHAASAKGTAGDDGPDPIQAALERLLNEPYSFEKRDRWATLMIPLADWQNWARIRIWGKPTRATFQYGKDKDYTALLTIRYAPKEGANDPASCLADFIKYASPIAENYGIRLGQSQLLEMSQVVRNEQKPILVRLQEGGVDSMIVADEYVGFMAAYQSWPGTCLVQGFAVVATDHPELATKVRDRWVREAVPKLSWDKKLKEAPDATLTR